MELTHTFTVSQPVDRAWQVITDLERVAPCLPGAALLGVDGDDHRGAVKIKVGPVTAQYEGVARFAERDDAAHRAVLRAEGRDVRGQGNAAATIDLRLTGQGGGTRVTVDTDLELAGRVAQFGRGVIADVSGKLMGQFAARLEEEMASGAPTEPVPAAAPATRGIDDVEPLDLLSSGSGAVLTRALPVATALLGLLVGVLLGRRSAGLALTLVLPTPEEGTR
ncbi:SRPBCC family protein [Pseudonocardia broussonetiae]|uniref:SRPBCC family protein n=1 Tax=Pseudonocardia broussonetiae TaxID=2736640 RepID=A0A6M6JU36_9PSEU|nr:SRPBCC family protein [Pseudonocardia broussonetiae]QJY49949.1 SRPBCC family protein [Pseudonocardia broussonetiae]